MKKFNLALLTTLSMLTGATAVMAADQYKIDPSHSYIGFEIKHLGYSNMIGRFDTVEGTFSFDEEKPANSSVEVKVNTGSVNTNWAERDNHIRTPELLSVDKFPEAKFTSTKVQVTGVDKAKISGTLTILGKELPVVVDAQRVGGGKDPWGGYRQGFSGHLLLKLDELGIGGFLGPQSNDVHLKIELEGIKQ